jgi:hypothetical protein
MEGGLKVSDANPCHEMVTLTSRNDRTLSYCDLSVNRTRPYRVLHSVNPKFLICRDPAGSSAS